MRGPEKMRSCGCLPVGVMIVCVFFGGYHLALAVRRLCGNSEISLTFLVLLLCLLAYLVERFGVSRIDFLF